MGRAAQCPGCGNALALISIPGPDAGSPAPQYAAFSQAAGTRAGGRKERRPPRPSPPQPPSLPTAPSPATPRCWLAEDRSADTERALECTSAAASRGLDTQAGTCCPQGRGNGGSRYSHLPLLKWKRGSQHQTYWRMWQVPRLSPGTCDLRAGKWAAAPPRLGFG